jgi:3-phosphoshikimate 1-carboxyvinyltransferase
MDQSVSRARRLEGSVSLPADKSIGHRTALLSALADGRSRIENYPSSADPHSTLDCVRQLGIAVEQDGATVHIDGQGLDGLSAPDAPLDCGNSGTTMRLLAGILAGQPFDSVLTGDASLRSRPMARIADPLNAMDAEVRLTDGHAPVHITGGATLQGMTYPLPIASAQVKSCVLLAGLFAEGTTTVIETTPSRDHTERMLGLDAHTTDGERHLTVDGGRRIPARTWHVPGDFSAAAFFLVAGSIVPGSTLHLNGVGMNPSRNALLEVLRTMDADITVANERMQGGEPIADLTVRHADLKATRVANPLIPNLIDEVPVLAVAAACATGRTEIRDAAELRVKETDRLDAMTQNLRALGVEVEEFEDGLAIDGPASLTGATVSSFDDHRIAMSMGVAGLVATGTTTITEAECASVSFPTFWNELRAVTAPA